MGQPLPELLAPAGNAVCLHAAVQAGADAAYLGLDSLNARRGADNFTLDTLEEACDYAHLRGVRVYLAMNTIVLPSEVASAAELAAAAYERGVDAFIVQDIGLASLIPQIAPEAQLHISTQMNIHSSAGLAAAKALGAARVTLARELALPEVAHLSAAAHELGMQVEVFAHGALCICYSGQCFASSLVGGRSANRGMCAQVCRLPYTLHDATAGTACEAPGEHLLSPKDLCTIDMLDQLLEAGVDSLKIEGRMKSPEYVHSVVATYRAALDRTSCHPGRGAQRGAEGSPEPLVTEEERQALEEAFSRGFTGAYLAGESGNSMMSYTRPNNRGVFAGRVAQAEGGVVQLDCELSLARGDVLEFWTNKGHFAHTVSAIEQGKQANRYLLRDVGRPVGKGDRVFRVRSAAMAFEDDAHAPRVPVSGSVVLEEGKPARVELSASRPGRAGEGQRLVASASGAVVERARTKAVAEDEVREHIGRFGSTPFQLAALDVHLDEGVGIGFSQLHRLRAKAAQALEDQMLAPWKGRTGTLPPAVGELQKLRRGAAVRVPAPNPAQIAVCALATSPATARAARKAGADAVYVPALNFKRGQAAQAGRRADPAGQMGYPKQVATVLPVASHDLVKGTREQKFSFVAWKYAKPGGVVLAESLADVAYALAQGMQVEAGPHVPLGNAIAANYLFDMGVSRIWLSPELNLGQIQAIAEQAHGALGLYVSGAAELMVTEHCLLQSEGPCNQDCPSCVRRESAHYLEDRKGYRMPVVTDCCGRSHLYNAVPLDLLHLLPDLAAAGISAVMVDTTLLDAGGAASACQRAVRARSLAAQEGRALPKQEGATTGHLFRGVS